MKSPKSAFTMVRLRATVFPLAVRLGRPLIWLRRRIKPHKVTLTKMETPAGTAEPLGVLCGLTGQSRHYFLNLAFEGRPHESGMRTARLMDVFRPNQNRNQDCALTVVETSQPHFDWLKQDGWFFIPVWVSGWVHLPIPDEFLKRETVRSDLRRIRRWQYAYEITHDEARFKDYYHNLHLPHVRQVHGEAACLDSFAEKRQQQSDYDLLLIHKKDQPGKDIAGILIIYERAGPRLWSLGVRKEDVDHVREGVIAALYHFAFEHLQAKGHVRTSLGNSRAFLHDGVLNFKKKVSQTLQDPSWQGLALKINALTPAVKKFLQKNPFIFFDNGRLCGAVFVDAEIFPEKIGQIVKSYFYPGLDRLIIYNCHSEAKAGKFNGSLLPPSLAGRVEIRPAADLIR